MDASRETSFERNIQQVCRAFKPPFRASVVTQFSFGLMQPALPALTEAEGSAAEGNELLPRVSSSFRTSSVTRNEEESRSRLYACTSLLPAFNQSQATSRFLVVPQSGTPRNDVAGAASLHDSALAVRDAPGLYPAGLPPTPLFFVCMANTGVRDAIVVCMATAGLKSVCFQKDSRPFVSADSKGVVCYLVGYRVH